MLRTGFLAKLLNRKGQSIVEIALITPLLLVALYVPADFGVAFSVAHLTQNAVRESARIAASTDPFDNAASTAIRNDALSRIPAWFGGSKFATVTFHADPDPPGNCARFVQVTGGGTYNYFLYQLIRLFGLSAPNNQQITRTARMRHAAQPATNHLPCDEAPTITSP
jgi:Flp pilus assembly protein TadG